MRWKQNRTSICQRVCTT